MDADLASEALSKCAGIAELEELKDIPLDPVYISALQSLLLDVYALLRPRPCDYENRSLLVQVLKKMVADTFGRSSGYLSVEAYGSFVMDLFTARSDLDLSINFSNGITDCPRDKKVVALRKLTRVFGVHQKNGVFKGLLPILHARVPVVKIVDQRSGIECDISVESKDGVLISQFFKLVSLIDGRFQILCYLMKLWAKAHDINSAKDLTINSLSLVTLVAFHLQTRKPPIFPPFSSLLRDGFGVSNVERNVTAYRNFGRSNQESVAELFITLLVNLASVNHLWQQGICASTYEGRWIYKLWKSGKGKMTVGDMSVEDFMNRSQNFSRCVGKAQMKKIAKCIADSLVDLSFFMRGQVDASRLKKLLFKSAGQDALGKLQSQKVELSKYPTVKLKNDKAKKKKKLKQKGKKASLEAPSISSISNDGKEEIGQKRKASSTDKRTLKKVKNAGPSRVNSVLPTPVAIPPIQPQSSDMSISNNKKEEFGQKRKALSSDQRTWKMVRNAGPSRVNSVLPTPVVIPPIQPHSSDMFNMPMPAYVLPQPSFVPHQLHNQVLPQPLPHQLHIRVNLPQFVPHQLHNHVIQPHSLSYRLPLPQTEYVPQPWQQPLVGHFPVPLRPLASSYELRNNQQNFVPYDNPTVHRTWNGDVNRLPGYHR